MVDNKYYSYAYFAIPILVLCFFFWGANLTSFFGSDKTESWIKAERETTLYTKGLKEDWVSFVSGWVTVKCKLRKSMSEKDSYDFVYKIESKLTEPRLKDSENELVKSYQLEPRFKLIDEDGFVVREIVPMYCNFDHEKYLSCVIWTEDDDPVERTVVASALIQNGIPENMAKRISKINYELGIHAEIESKEPQEISWEKNDTRKWRLIRPSELKTASTSEDLDGSS